MSVNKANLHKLITWCCNPYSSSGRLWTALGQSKGWCELLLKWEGNIHTHIYIHFPC